MPSTIPPVGRSAGPPWHRWPPCAFPACVAEAVRGRCRKNVAGLIATAGHLLSPSACLRLGIVVELPCVHRADIGRTEGRAMHRVRMLEQDRRSFLRDDGTANERAHRVDRHRGDTGGVAHVRLGGKDADVDAVSAHRRLQPRQPLEAEDLDIVRDVGHGGWIPRASGPGADETAVRPPPDARTVGRASDG